MINYHLSQNLKLLRNDKFNYLTIILIVFFFYISLDWNALIPSCVVKYQRLGFGQKKGEKIEHKESKIKK